MFGAHGLHSPSRAGSRGLHASQEGARMSSCSRARQRTFGRLQHSNRRVDRRRCSALASDGAFALPSELVELAVSHAALRLCLGRRAITHTDTPSRARLNAHGSGQPHRLWEVRGRPRTHICAGQVRTEGRRMPCRHGGSAGPGQVCCCACKQGCSWEAAALFSPRHGDLVKAQPR